MDFLRIAHSFSNAGSANAHTEEITARTIVSYKTVLCTSLVWDSFASSHPFMRGTMLDSVLAICSLMLIKICPQTLTPH